MKISGQFHALTTLPPKKRAPGIHWIGGWVGSRVSLDMVVKRKIPSLPLPLLWRVFLGSSTCDMLILDEWKIVIKVRIWTHICYLMKVSQIFNVLFKRTLHWTMQRITEVCFLTKRTGPVYLFSSSILSGLSILEIDPLSCLSSSLLHGLYLKWLFASYVSVTFLDQILLF